VHCLGCGCDGVALCDACAPARAEAQLFTVGGVPVLAAGEYDALLRRAIVAMKRGERAYLEPFAGLIARSVPPGVVLVPLPTTRGRAAARGFDQGVELARRAAKLAGVDWRDVLSKSGPSQRGRTRTQRLETYGRFRLRSGAEPPAHAVLVDDVCTTGGTIAAALDTLHAAG